MSTRFKAIATALLAVALGVVIWAVLSMNNTTAEPIPSDEDQRRAALAWANMDETSRDIVCDIYMSESQEEEGLEAVDGFAQAKLDLMEGTCVDE